MPKFLPFNRPSDVTSTFHNRLVTVTGHRPQKCGGFSAAAQLLLKQIAIDWLAELKPRGAISGMALGWDTAIVQACLYLGLPYAACIPFTGQESQWPLESRREYHQLLGHAAKIIVCSPGGYAPAKMQVRNERMVDLALKDGPTNGLLLSLWDGTSGGTKNCLLYGQNKIDAINVWSDLSYRRS